MHQVSWQFDFLRLRIPPFLLCASDAQERTGREKSAFPMKTSRRTLQFGIAISEQNGLSTSCTLFFRKFTKHVWRRNWDFGGDKKTENNDRWTLRNAKSVRRSVSLLEFWSQDIGRRDYWGNHVGECS
ncbi:hypothetical protein QLX08_008635 [Tetragonisca angustula]|uniref:Uncharacterized protein n=1 Tax=Tetragonisca angustula TaxID=166442 RepID=A0AAW0ZLA8_9HYME